MPKIHLSFEAEDPEQLASLIAKYQDRYYGALPSAPDVSEEFPDDDEEARIEAGVAAAPASQLPAPAPTPQAPTPQAPTPQAPAPQASRPRGRPPKAVSAPAPEPAPAPAPELESGHVNNEMPGLETLKQVITVAVRQAQSNEGPRKVLDLLPDFKAKTGLRFIMHAEEKHRKALYDLVQAANIPVV